MDSNSIDFGAFVSQYLEDSNSIDYDAFVSQILENLTIGNYIEESLEDAIKNAESAKKESIISAKEEIFNIKMFVFCIVRQFTY